MDEVNPLTFEISLVDRALTIEAINSTVVGLPGASLMMIDAPTPAETASGDHSITRLNGMIVKCGLLSINVNMLLAGPRLPFKLVTC